MIPDTLHSTLWSLALSGVLGLAIWRGEAPEKTAIAGVVFGHLITMLFRSPVVVIWAGAQWPIVFADASTLGVAVYVLARSRRWWPILSVAFQSISLFWYLAPLVEPGIRASAYHASSVAFDYMNLLAIGLGTLIEGRRGRLAVDAQ